MKRMIEALEQRTLMSAGFIFIGTGVPHSGFPGYVYRCTPSGGSLDGNDIESGDAVAVSGTDVFVLTDPSGDGYSAPGVLGEYRESGEAVNATLLQNLNNPLGLAISGSDIFILDGDGTVGEYTTAGATVHASLISGLTNPLEVAVDGSHLFVTSGSYEENDGKIGEYSLTGATINASLVTGLSLQSYYCGLAASGSKLFVSTTSGVAEYSTSGATINSAFTSVAGTYGLTVFESDLYVMDGAIDEYGFAGNHVSSEPLGGGFAPYIDIAIAEAAPVNASPLSLHFEAQPEQDGTTLSTTVCLEDAQGELVSDAVKTVTLNVASGPTGGQLAGTYSEALTQGAAVFDQFALNEDGTYTLTASDGADSPGVSNSFVWTESAESYHLSISGEPGVSIDGTNPDDSTVQVELLDELGNVVTNSSATVLVHMVDEPTGAVLEGTRLLAVPSDGIALFSDLTVSEYGSYTLVADSDSGTAAEGTTGAFTLAPDPTAVVSVVGSGATFVIGQPITFTASVSSATAGQATPTGTVSFTDAVGDVLGTSTLDGDGTATLTTTFITPDAHVITAIYNGDGTYTAGVSATVTETSVTAGSTATSVFGKVKAPTSVINGVAFGSSLPLKILSGTGVLNGKFTIKLYAEPVGEADGTQTYVTQIVKKLNLKSLGSATVVIRLKSIPATVAAGSYELVAEVTDPLGGVGTTMLANTLQVTAPVIQPTVSVSGLTPSSILSGKMGSITVTVKNEGNVVAKGLSISLSTLDIEFLKSPLASYNMEGAALKPGKTVKVKFKFQVPTDIVAGSYSSVAAVTLDGVEASATGAGFSVT